MLHSFRRYLIILIVPTVDNMSFFNPHLRFFTIVNDFNVCHQPCYDYNYEQEILS